MVHTRLSAIKKKYILPTSGSVDITNGANNDSNNVASAEKTTEVVVPETQIVDATQNADVSLNDTSANETPESPTQLVATHDSFSYFDGQDDVATELEKTPVKDLSETGEKSSHEACTNTTSTPPSKAKSPSFVLDGTELKIGKFGYLTP